MSNEWQCMYEDAEAEVKHLRAEVERLRVNAERYEWLRDEALHMVDEAPLCFMADDCCDAISRLTGLEMDAAIDAARGVKS
jgi:hypothetical protein